VNHLSVVKGRETFCDLLYDGQRIARVERAALEALGECLAVEKLHRQKDGVLMTCVFPSNVEDTADIRMRNPARKLNLAAEAGRKFRIGQES